MEKVNCVYCSYFNGLMSYLREIAGRTEQYWCPIRTPACPKALIPAMIGSWITAMPKVTGIEGNQEGFRGLQERVRDYVARCPE